MPNLLFYNNMELINSDLNGLKASGYGISQSFLVVCSEKSVFKSLSERVMRTIKIGGGLKD